MDFKCGASASNVSVPTGGAPCFNGGICVLNENKGETCTQCADGYGPDVFSIPHFYNCTLPTNAVLAFVICISILMAIGLAIVVWLFLVSKQSPKGNARTAILLMASSVNASNLGVIATYMSGGVFEASLVFLALTSTFGLTLSPFITSVLLKPVAAATNRLPMLRKVSRWFWASCSVEIVIMNALLVAAIVHCRDENPRIYNLIMIIWFFIFAFVLIFHCVGALLVTIKLAKLFRTTMSAADNSHSNKGSAGKEAQQRMKKGSQPHILAVAQTTGEGDMPPQADLLGGGATTSLPKQSSPKIRSVPNKSDGRASIVKEPLLVPTSDNPLFVASPSLTTTSTATVEDSSMSERTYKNSSSNNNNNSKRTSYPVPKASPLKRGSTVSLHDQAQESKKERMYLIYKQLLIIGSVSALILANAFVTLALVITWAATGSVPYFWVAHFAFFGSLAFIQPVALPFTRNLFIRSAPTRRPTEMFWMFSSSIAGTRKEKSNGHQPQEAFHHIGMHEDQPLDDPPSNEVSVTDGETVILPPLAGTFRSVHHKSSKRRRMMMRMNQHPVSWRGRLGSLLSHISEEPHTFASRQSVSSAAPPNV